MKVKKVCILGGGTAGFSVAAVFAKYAEMVSANLDITVVYSSEIGKIGVGESTLLSINDLFNYLGLKDEDWMKECNATYKTSISFENFYKKGSSFQYPFGDMRLFGQLHLRKWFQLKEYYPDIFSPEVFARYILPHTRMNEKNRLTEEQDIYGYNFDLISAYHFDTHLLSKFLRKYAEDRGVKFIDDFYKESVLDSKGNIEKIICENNTIDSDIFFDCSGFRSLLLNGVMKEEFIDYNHTLINNRVVRAKIPYTNKEKQLKNYTNCVALDNGWCWEIPLWDSLSVGYVHSLKFASEDAIRDEFKKHCLEKHSIDIDKENINIDIINYKTGRYKRGWVKNVIGVGLAYGFLEPLESTGILTLLQNTFRALELLSKRDLFWTNVDRDMFNHGVAAEVDSLRGFVEMHYAFSSRDDSEYWRYVTEDIEYPKEFQTTYYDIMQMTIINRDYFVGNTGIPFIISGMNYSHFSPACIKNEPESEDITQMKELFVKEDERLYSIVEKYPSTMKFLEQKIYGKENS